MLASTTYEMARLHAEDIARDARRHNRDARLRVPRRQRAWSAPVACRTCPGPGDDMTSGRQVTETMSTARLLSELGERVAADGPAAHHSLLVELSTIAARVAPGAAAVLADSQAAPVARARALAVATRAIRREAATHDPARLHDAA